MCELRIYPFPSTSCRLYKFVHFRRLCAPTAEDVDVNAGYGLWTKNSSNTNNNKEKRNFLGLMPSNGEGEPQPHSSSSGGGGKYISWALPENMYYIMASHTHHCRRRRLAGTFATFSFAFSLAAHRATLAHILRIYQRFIRTSRRARSHTNNTLTYHSTPIFIG